MNQNTETTQPLVLQVPSSVESLIEALIFAAEEPLTPQQVKSIYENSASGSERRTIDATHIESIVRQLNEQYKKQGRPYRIIAVAGGYQFATLADYAAWIGRLQKEQSRRKLSQSAVETLAMIAYKQPISKPEIEMIRGVNCDYVLKTLLEKDLITVTGRAPSVGRPLLYGTTRQFLLHFGLRDVVDLPRPREIEEILGESQFETERRMLEAQAAAREAEREKLKEDLESRLPHIPRKQAAMDESVEIVPKRRSKSIRTSTDETEKARPETIIESAESQSPPASVPPAAPDAETETEVRATDGEGTHGSVVAPGKTQTIPPTAYPRIHSPAQEVQPRAGRVPPEAHSVGEAEDERARHQPSRWQLWKNKIQGILKKLFG